MSTINVHLTSNSSSIHTHLSAPFIQPYGGPYSLTPKVYAQSFPTAGKRMLENTVVVAIPDWRVTNDTGGLTITIGGIL